MADLRIIPGSQPSTAVRPTGSSEAVKAAQRAFFQAALNQAQPQTIIKSVAVEQTDVRPVMSVRASTSSTSGEASPSRILRPGSLLDIKV